MDDVIIGFLIGCVLGFFTSIFAVFVPFLFEPKSKEPLTKEDWKDGFR